jgi:type VI secretion system secreted protein Hcp
MTPSPLRPLFLALTMALLPVAGAMAASNLYLDIPGIPGASQSPGHVGQIHVQDFTWSASMSITKGPRGENVAGVLTTNDIRWTQSGEVASAVPLFDRAKSGTPLARASFQIVDSAQTSSAPWLELTAQDALISSLGYAGGAGNPVRVQGSMNTAVLSLGVNPKALGSEEGELVTKYSGESGKLSGPLARPPQHAPGNVPTHAGLYLRLTDRDSQIAGDQTTIGYENWIAIDSYGLSASNPPGPGGAPGGKPVFDEFSWSQRLDATAPVILGNLLGGQTLDHATLEQVVIGRNGVPMTVMQQAFDQVIFTSFQLSAQEDGDSRVDAKLSFGRVSQTFWGQQNGSRIRMASVGYDTVTGRSFRGVLASNVPGYGTGNLDGTAAPIPEPQTWALLLAGLAAVLVRARRQRTGA